MRRSLLIGGLVAALLIGWVILRPDSNEYEVQGRTDEAGMASVECTKLPGVDADKSSFMLVADAPVVPGHPNGAVSIPVSGKDQADAVADCLADHGVIDVTVNGVAETGPPSTFARTDS